MGLVKEYLGELEDEKLMEEVQKLLDANVPPAEILEECQEGMVVIGDKFANGEMFVSDLMMSGALFKEVSEMLDPYMKKGDGAVNLGKVVIGTVKDDIHDIGKDIVGNMLKANGFEVIDVGVDAPVEAFISALKESNAKVLGLSCLLASCYGSIKETVEAVRKETPDVKIIIGGGPIDETVKEYSGADAYAVTAQDTVNFFKEVLC